MKGPFENNKVCAIAAVEEWLIESAEESVLQATKSEN